VFRAGAVSRALQKLHRHKRIEEIRDAADAERVLGPFARRLAGVGRVS
jgi:hypothetical protein